MRPHRSRGRHNRAVSRLVKTIHADMKGTFAVKKLLNSVGTILNIGLIIWDVTEFLAFPILFVIIGLVNKYSWEYYAISICGYFALFIILEIVLRLVFKALDKKYTPIMKRKLEKIFDRFSRED